MGPFGDFAKNFVALFNGGSPVDGTNPLPVARFNALVPEIYDSISLTYVTAGNGIGEIETVTYKLAAATQAVLTISYDANDNVSSVVKT